MLHTTHFHRAGQAGKALRIFLLLLVVLFGLALLYTWITLSYNYSDGERAGYIQKISRKGWICKTWEGDLALVNLPGQPAEIFAFSVRDDEVAAQINALIGKRVSLSYEEHVGVPTNCFAETRYYVIGVREVKTAELP
ncbi:hypothetical protein [Uliginosibacterium sp. H1]|uniref:hypothetical protein n=1 Tax=Uliginosibacterium sp. H1 TaxID=3114757 RepID=UPI002E195A28|nr:hypothetical protein [Uliginosibacterium sp. H1]